MPRKGGWKERVGRDKLSWKERSSVARAHEVVGCAVWSEEEGRVVHELDDEAKCGELAFRDDQRALDDDRVEFDSIHVGDSDGVDVRNGRDGRCVTWDWSWCECRAASWEKVEPVAGVRGGAVW